MSTLILLVTAAVFQSPALPAYAKARFPHSKATALLSSPKPGSPAEMITQHVQKRTPHAIVAEDGSAIALLVGTVSKIDTKTGAILTTEDKYRLEIRGKKMTAFSVSQETSIRSTYKGAIDLSLSPLILLDRYRTLCVNGALSARSAVDPRTPRRTLFLALIDDRQRGKSPNLVRTVKLREEPGLISAIGVQGDRYILRVSSGTGARFLAVNPKTLANRWIQQPAWSGFAGDTTAIKKTAPKWIAQVRTRWASKSYFLANPAYGQPEKGYVWDGKGVKETGSFYLPAASINGKYAWLVDRAGSGQWLLSR